jgi:hypothetical protein
MAWRLSFPEIHHGEHGGHGGEKERRGEERNYT